MKFSVAERTAVLPVIHEFKDLLSPNRAFNVAAVVAEYLFGGVLLSRFPQLLQTNAPGGVTFRWRDTLGGKRSPRVPRASPGKPLTPASSCPTNHTLSRSPTLLFRPRRVEPPSHSRLCS